MEIWCRYYPSPPKFNFVNYLILAPIKLLSVMCRLHDDTPSLMRVWFLELWEGCVAQYAVYAHRATGAISQGGYLY